MGDPTTPRFRWAGYVVTRMKMKIVDEARRRSSSYDGVNMKMVDGRLVILGESVFVVFVSVFLDGG